MPSQPVTTFADQLHATLAKELDRPKVAQARTVEVLTAFLLTEHHGAIEIGLEAIRTLPAGLELTITVTDDAAGYRVEVTDEDGQSYRLPTPIDGRTEPADALAAWSGLPSEASNR